MSFVYLLRHCRYDNPRKILPGRLPLELSAEGKQTAKRLCDHFQDKNIGRIYTSAVLRCRQTAEIVADGKIPIVFDQRLLETLSAYQGFWGENWHGDGFHFFTHRPELGGENLADIQKRMASFWDEVIPDLKENIIILSHGDPLQALYAYVHHLPLPADNAQEKDIPGWLNPGEFLEIETQGKKIISTG